MINFVQLNVHVLPCLALPCRLDPKKGRSSESSSEDSEEEEGGGGKKQGESKAEENEEQRESEEEEMEQQEGSKVKGRKGRGGNVLLTSPKIDVWTPN